MAWILYNNVRIVIQASVTRSRLQTGVVVLKPFSVDSSRLKLVENFSNSQFLLTPATFRERSLLNLVAMHFSEYVTEHGFNNRYSLSCITDVSAITAYITKNFIYLRDEISSRNMMNENKNHSLSSQNFYVVVVDDEFDLVSLFRDALNRIEGCTVFGFTDPELALEHFIINQKYYQLILSDFRMPGLTGIELIKRVNEIKPSIKALLMSAFEVRDDEIFQECVTKNIITGFLQKPVRMSDLIDEVTKQISPQPQIREN